MDNLIKQSLLKNKSVLFIRDDERNHLSERIMHEVDAIYAYRTIDEVVQWVVIKDRHNRV